MSRRVGILLVPGDTFASSFYPLTSPNMRCGIVGYNLTRRFCF